VYAVTKDGVLWFWGCSDGLFLPEFSEPKKPMKIGKIDDVKEIYAGINVLYVLKRINLFGNWASVVLNTHPQIYGGDSKNNNATKR